MNKQEAINELKKYKVGFGEAAAVRFDRIVSVINQIHEPQKVVVPKFIDDLIKELKLYEYTIGGIGAFVYGDVEQKWIDDNEELFYRAFLDGYEVKQEKLYTVEIPNPNANKRNATVLKRMKDNDNAIELCVYVRPDFNDSDFQLTESEIKQDFEWAWQFAKEVEVE
ncbi:DUF1642 domain-containing protein [Streptococcus suis]|uniref:DUF1642 domain-containing protein n=1 Tax=Streptococcus suis TaxID=1307 RepID=UPI000CF6666E|nr:DUF1642 domain-containing protein [Streptococcus suis]